MREGKRGNAAEHGWAEHGMPLCVRRTCFVALPLSALIEDAQPVQHSGPDGAASTFTLASPFPLAPHPVLPQEDDATKPISQRYQCVAQGPAWGTSNPFTPSVYEILRPSWTGARTRAAFNEFFETKAHTYVPSSSVGVEGCALACLEGRGFVGTCEQGGFSVQRWICMDLAAFSRRCCWDRVWRCAELGLAWSHP